MFCGVCNLRHPESVLLGIAACANELCDGEQAAHRIYLTSNRNFRFPSIGGELYCDVSRCQGVLLAGLSAADLRVGPEARTMD